MDSRFDALLESQRRIETSLAAITNSQAHVQEALRGVERKISKLVSQPSAMGVMPSSGTTSTAVKTSRDDSVVGASDGAAVGHSSTDGGLDGEKEASGWLPLETLPSTRSSELGDKTVGRESESIRWGGGERLAPTLPQGWPTSLALRQGLGLVGTEVDPRSSVTLNPGRRRMLVLNPGALAEQEVEVSPFLLSLQEPDSLIHQAFDAAAFLLISYDLIVVPYTLAWDEGHSRFVAAMDWILVSFWTADIALSFLTGFYQDGDLITSFKETSQRYLRTWFLPDLTMVLVDWLGVILLTVADAVDDHEHGNGNLLQIAKLGKILRIIDLLRFLRFVRAFETFVERRLSNMVRLVLRIASITGSILWGNHVLACIWYAVGRTAPSDTGSHWLDQIVPIPGSILEYRESSAVYQYATSFHWAITQCTLSSMELAASNSAERIMICVCMLIGLVFGSGLISLISSTMVEMRMLARDRSQKVNVLRNYLLENQVEKRFALYVQRQVTERLHERGRLMAKDVPALMILSSSARRELHANIVKPHLTQHPLFSLFHCIDRSWFQRLCSEAADMVFLRPSDDLFVAGVLATSTYYLVSGRLGYTQEPESALVEVTTARFVEQGTWLCEAALWCEWIHVGKAEALQQCQVLVLNAEAAVKLLSQHRLVHAIVADYGLAYHQCVMRARPPVSNWPDDVEVPSTEYSDLVGSCSMEVQISLSMIALENWKPKGGNPLWNMSKGARGTVMDAIRGEVEGGKSLVVMTGTGDLVRVVKLVVLHLIREDDYILVQLGKWEGSRSHPDCQLPGLKCGRYEDVDAGLERLLSTKLAVLSGCLVVTRIESQVLVKDSRGFKLRTRYLRKVHLARLTASFEAPLCPYRSTRDVRSGEGEEMDALPISAAELAEQPPVYFLRYQDKGIFCAWMSAETFSRLKTPSGEHVVRDWLQNVRPPASELAYLEDGQGSLASYNSEVLPSEETSDADSDAWCI